MKTERPEKNQYPGGQKCGWRVRCSYLKRSEKYKITVAELNHSCPGNIHSWRGPLGRAGWLAEVFGNRIALDFNRPIGQLLNEFRANYYKEVQYLPVFRMRQLCQEELIGADASAFSQIPALLDRIQKADPKAVANWSTVDGVYEEALGILEKDYPNGKEAIAYIKAIDPRKFSRYALVLPRYGRVTSNAVECMNAAFLKLREYAARRLLFEVWIYVMRSFYERRTTVEGSIDLLTEYAKGRLSEFEREYGRYVTYNADDDNALVQTNGGVDQWIVQRHPRLSCSCYEPQEMQWPCIHVMSWCKGKGEDYLPYVDRIYFQKSLLACYNQAIPPVIEQDLVIHITCRAPEVAVRRGRARTMRIPNGGGSSRRHREYMYPVQDEARLISSQGPLIAISDQAAGPRHKMVEASHRSGVVFVGR
ncbi:hypothetical protein R1flu_021874 [Riccia fluitans]|uniref:SWIM-type domain-containing protein n=1 Tax=Riccia fluitans TaxID=41844 RepID=A0ABD1ZQL5_9MARC